MLHRKVFSCLGFRNHLSLGIIGRYYCSNVDNEVFSKKRYAMMISYMGDSFLGLQMFVVFFILWMIILMLIDIIGIKDLEL